MTLKMCWNIFLEYSESDYVYDDSIDEFLTAKTPNNFGKEYKYGAYQAILLGHTPDIRLRDEGRRINEKVKSV